MDIDKLFWVYSSDGTCIYVKRSWYSYFKRVKTQTIALFFVSDFIDPVSVAEDFIKRTTKEREIEKDKRSNT